MFKSWLVSNFGIVYFVGAIIILAGIPLFHLTAANGDMGLLLLVSAIVAGVLAFIIYMASGSSAGPVLIAIFLIAGYCFLVFLLQHPKEGVPMSAEMINKMNTYVIIISLVALIPAFFIARYAYRNFDDVVDCRWLYRNSDKDVFVSTWKYAFNRFLMAFLVFFALLLLICSIVYMIHAL